MAKISINLYEEFVQRSNAMFKTGCDFTPDSEQLAQCIFEMEIIRIANNPEENLRWLSDVPLIKGNVARTANIETSWPLMIGLYRKFMALPNSIKVTRGDFYSRVCEQIINVGLNNLITYPIMAPGLLLSYISYDEGERVTNGRHARYGSAIRDILFICPEPQEDEKQVKNFLMYLDKYGDINGIQMNYANGIQDFKEAILADMEYHFEKEFDGAAFKDRDFKVISAIYSTIYEYFTYSPRCKISELQKPIYKDCISRIEKLLKGSITTMLDLARYDVKRSRIITLMAVSKDFINEEVTKRNFEPKNYEDIKYKLYRNYPVLMLKTATILNPSLEMDEKRLYNFTTGMEEQFRDIGGWDAVVEVVANYVYWQGSNKTNREAELAKVEEWIFKEKDPEYKMPFPEELNKLKDFIYRGDKTRITLHGKVIDKLS